MDFKVHWSERGGWGEYTINTNTRMSSNKNSILYNLKSRKIACILTYCNLLFQVRELIKTTKICIKNCDLQNAKRASTSRNVLARNLLQLVFKKEALVLCSLRGKPPHGPGAGVTVDCQRGLHQGGIDVILS